MRVAWGGAAGAFEDGGLVAVATTSSGDRRIDPSDSFVTVMQNARRSRSDARAVGHGPSAHVLGTARRCSRRRATCTATRSPTRGPASIPRISATCSRSTLRRADVALVTFVVKGLSEVYDPRGGFPIPRARCAALDLDRPVYTGADARNTRCRLRDRARDRRRAQLARRPTFAA